MAYFGENRDIPGLTVLNDAILGEVQHFASRGLTREEILEGYSIEWDMLSTADQKAFKEYYNYGKVVGLKSMSDALFQQAKGKNGTAAALAYLLRFGAKFEPLNEGSSAAIIIRDETGKSIVPDSNVKIS
jgi:hypothetical protein